MREPGLLSLLLKHPPELSLLSLKPSDRLLELQLECGLDLLVLVEAASQIIEVFLVLGVDGLDLLNVLLLGCL